MANRISQTYATFSIDDLAKVDFSQVGETEETTIRRSIDLTQFILKWNSEPTFIEDGEIVPIQTLTHLQALNLMSTPEWSEIETDINE
jgi:hypothetical protein